MKSVGLLTLDSHSYNYGGVLQEYALCRILEDSGCNVEIINFDQSSEINTFSYKRNLLNLSFTKVAAKAKQKLSSINKIDISKEVSLRHKKFDDFRTSYMKLSKPYIAKNISKSATEYDTLVCGSDQIWNPDFNVPEFFLNFALEGQKRVIYGASLGCDQLTKRQLRVYKKLMAPLKSISVREDKAKEVLQPISQPTIEVVLDPTLLIEQEQWSELIRIPNQMNSDYIFCYFLDNSLRKQNAAKKVAQEMGLKIATIPYLHDVYEVTSECFGDYKLSDVGPQEFLGLISNSRLVLTDSFHATVFSLLFKKDFWTFGRECGSYNMNSRIITLLQYFDLLDRFVKIDEDCSKKCCRYDLKYEKIELQKVKSLSFLKESI